MDSWALDWEIAQRWRIQSCCLLVLQSMWFLFLEYLEWGGLDSEEQWNAERIEGIGVTVEHAEGKTENGNEIIGYWRKKCFPPECSFGPLKEIILDDVTSKKSRISKNSHVSNDCQISHWGYLMTWHRAVFIPRYDYSVYHHTGSSLYLLRVFFANHLIL